jgi:hypothetical protein
MNSNQEQTRHLAQANGMYENIARQMVRARRAAIIWGILLVILALSFGALTTAAFSRIGVDPITAYILGVFLHLLLGLSKVGWQWADATRRVSFGIVCRLGVIVLILAILVVAYFRADLQVERGRPVLAAYLVSFFVALLEIVGPLVVGTFLGDAFVRSEELREDLDWCDSFRRAMTNTQNPDGHWHDEGAELRRRIEICQSNIKTWEGERERAITEHRHADARRFDEQIEQAKREIQHFENLYSLLRKFYPGSHEDFERNVAAQLRQASASTPPTQSNP